MQYKKDEVKNRMIDAGEAEFFEYGFKGSSVRRIVKNAGTTIGNFYNYFSNKEELYNEVVESELHQFGEFINGHEDLDNTDDLLDLQNPAAWFSLIEDNTEIFMPVFTKRFYILLACSGGTSFEDSREKIQEFVKMHFLRHVSKSRAKIENADATADALVYEFIEGILYIIKNHGDTDKAKILIKNHMLFFLMGVMGMLQGGAQYDKS